MVSHGPDPPESQEEHNAFLGPQRATDHKTRLQNTFAYVSQRVPLMALLSIVLLLSTASRLINLPLNRIMELRLCQDFYDVHDPSRIAPDGSVPEAMCKLDAIQQKLGWLQGALETAMIVVDLVVAIPLGFLMDRLGSRLVLSLNCTAIAVLLSWINIIGHARNVPVEVMLAGPFLAAYGGGTCVLRAVTLSTVSKLSRSDTERTSNIALLCSLDYATSLFGPTIAAALMYQSLWLPTVVGFVLLGAALPLIGLLPSSSKPYTTNTTGPAPEDRTSPENSRVTSERTPLLSDSDSTSSNSSIEARNLPDSGSSDNGLRAFLRQYAKVITSGKNYQLLLACAFFHGFAISSTGLIPLYVSKRYGWRIAKVGFLLTLKASINVFMLAVVVPLCSRTWLRRAASEGNVAKKEIFACGLLLLTSGFGAALIGASPHIGILIPSLCIAALGTAFPVFLFAAARSISTTALHDNNGNEGTSFTVLVVVQTCGALIGTPAITAAWVEGMQLGGIWLGLPYYLAAVAYLVACVVVCNIRV